MKRLLVVFAFIAALLPASLSTAQPLPAEVCATLRAARAAIPHAPPLSKAELGALLNRAAWQHRGDGWGLHSKPEGNNCPIPSGTLVSCDYLVRSGTGWDVLQDSDGVANVVCGEGSPETTGWVAPIDPGNTPPPLPCVDLSPLFARLDAIQIVERVVAEKLDTIESKVDKLQASLEEHRAEARKVKAWAKDWKNWLAVIGGLLAGLGLGAS